MVEQQLEIEEGAWRAVSAFVRALPPPTSSADASGRGGELFERVGCARCHRLSLTVAAGTNGIEQARTIHPYTDLLLHDMGPALADGLREGDASPQEFRTPSLWGLSRSGPPYLHDGRARTIHDAIVMHDGEAARAVTAYNNLSPSDRQTLLRFVESRE